MVGVVKLKIGNRVTRPVYMDNGVWQKRGDSCLPESPLLHGTVIEIDYVNPPEVKVRWDETYKSLWYFEHGLTFISER